MRWLKSCVAAFRFLTIMPLPTSFGSAAEDLGGSLYFFPLVGMVLGLLAAAGAWLLWMTLPPFAAATALTILLFSFSGALHLDGLADTADGFFSARSREKILGIMRDSRIGVMGVAGLFAILLLKVSGLSAIAAGAEAAKVAFLMVLAGRCMMVVMMALLPYVRPQGLGTLFFLRSAFLPALSGIMLFFLLCFTVYGIRGVVLAGLVLLILLLFCVFCSRRIGGATGDTMGAACEIAEASVAVICAAGI
ncbi:MAG: adenosylcobinamide-GDP ribazoletransferase [Desulfobulbaceae bacterium]|nr:adenosylcobinamide-GDP ribazoletransferase [Desulfobulbaceae bacterium]